MTSSGRDPGCEAYLLPFPEMGVHWIGFGKIFCARTRDLFQLFLRGQLQIVGGDNRPVPVPPASEFRVRKFSGEIFRTGLGKAQHNIMPQYECDRMHKVGEALAEV